MHTVELTVDQVVDNAHLRRIVDLVNREAYVSNIHVRTEQENPQ